MLKLRKIRSQVYALASTSSLVSTITISSIDNIQYRCQHDQVVDCRHGGAVLPLVDCLRGGETENFLQVADGKACLLPQSCNVFFLLLPYQLTELPSFFFLLLAEEFYWFPPPLF